MNDLFSYSFAFLDLISSDVLGNFKFFWQSASAAEITRAWDRLYLDQIVSVIKVIAAIASVILGLLLYWIKQKAAVLKSPPSPISNEQVDASANPSSESIPAPAQGGAMIARWQEITRHLDSAKEAEWKLAIIEADKLIDDVLRRGGFPGATIGERLINIPDGQIANLEGLWYAHKIRNRIAHDIDYFLKYSEAKLAIGYYEAVLREFELL